MRFSLYLTAGLTVIGFAAANSFAAIFTFDGSTDSDWHTAANWTILSGSDGDGIPDATDDVVTIPDPVSGIHAVTITSASPAPGALYIQVQGDSTLSITGTNAVQFELSGTGNNGTSVIQAVNGFKFDNPNADLLISSVHVIQGDGTTTSSVFFENIDDVIIASGDKLTLDNIEVYGEADFTDSGTLELQADAILSAADGSDATGTMTLASTLDLVDAVGSLWEVEAGGTMVFNKAETLAGDVGLFGGGTLSFVDDVGFTNASSDFEWDNGTLTVAAGKKFTYQGYSAGSACSLGNPDTDSGSCDSSDPPYEVCGSYSTNCTP